MSLLSIFADFNNTDVQGRVRLNTNGAIKDIREKNIILHNGLEVILDDGNEFKVKGTIEFSIIENIWVGKPDWTTSKEY